MTAGIYTKEDKCVLIFVEINHSTGMNKGTLNSRIFYIIFIYIGNNIYYLTPMPGLKKHFILLEIIQIFISFKKKKLLF